MTTTTTDPLLKKLQELVRSILIHLDNNRAEMATLRQRLAALEAKTSGPAFTEWHARSIDLALAVAESADAVAKLAEARSDTYTRIYGETLRGHENRLRALDLVAHEAVDAAYPKLLPFENEVRSIIGDPNILAPERLKDAPSETPAPATKTSPER